MPNKVEVSHISVYSTLKLLYAMTNHKHISTNNQYNFLRSKRLVIDIGLRACKCTVQMLLFSNMGDENERDRYEPVVKMTCNDSTTLS